MADGTAQARGRTGRRPGGATDGGGSGAREGIVGAARRLFAEQGVATVSVRAVAREAGVDPALVRHYFGSRDGLLRAVLTPPVRTDEVVHRVAGGDPATVGARLARVVAEVVADDARVEVLTGLVRAAATEPAAAAALRDNVVEGILRPVADALAVDRPDLRAALAASQVLGFVVAARIVGLEPLAGADGDAVERLLGPTLQRYLTGDLGAVGAVALAPAAPSAAEVRPG